MAESVPKLAGKLKQEGEKLKVSGFASVPLEYVHRLIVSIDTLPKGLASKVSILSE
jgi:hypothetical protein